MTSSSRAAIPSLYPEHVARLQKAYENLCATHGLDAVLLHAGVARPRSIFDDQFWPLRVMPHFAHWTPLAEADAVLVIRPGRKPALHRLVEKNFWEQPAPAAPHALSQFDVVEAGSLDIMRRQLPAASSRTVFVGEFADRALSLGYPLDVPKAVLRAIEETRVHKSAYDLACLVEANRITALGHQKVRDAFLDGHAHSELDLHLLYLGATEQDDADTPYKNIVALGDHAATLHHVSYGRARDTHPTSLLLDAGVAYLGYASDVTRTYVRGQGTDVDVFGALIGEVDTLQQRLCSDVKVGLPYEQLHDRAHAYLADALKKVGIVTGSTADALSQGITRAFLPHGLGHSLGVTCHDVGCADIRPRADNPFLRNTRPIEVDQVFTIEPGVYFIPDLLAPLRNDQRASLVDWKLVDTLSPLGGIRIEDDLRVVKSGVENMTRAYGY